MRSFHGPNLSQNGEAAITTHPPLPNKALTQTSGHFSMSKPTQPHRSQLFDILHRLAQTHSPFSLCLPVAKHSQNHAPSGIFIRGLLSSLENMHSREARWTTLSKAQRSEVAALMLPGTRSAGKADVKTP